MILYLLKGGLVVQGTAFELADIKLEIKKEDRIKGQRIGRLLKNIAATGVL